MSESPARVPDLIVTGGTVVRATGRAEQDLAVIDGRIFALGERGAFGTRARQVIDATGLLVMPGGVDPHCHFGTLLDGSAAEDEQYSSAAAFGGTTTILDFVFQVPPTSLHDAIEAKKARTKGSMAVDYGLHAIVTGEVSFEVLEEIGDVIGGGIPSIKTFMTYDSVAVDDGHRWAVMREVADSGGLSIVHAEDSAISAWLVKRNLRDGKSHGRHIIDTHGPLVEEAAVRRALLLAERAGTPLYVLHVGAESAMQAIAEARQRGVAAFGETLAAYLSFTEADLDTGDDRGLLWNNFPVLKYERDRAALWDAIAEDRLQAVSSDHWANTIQERLEAGTTVDQLQSGQAAIELRLPVVYHLGVGERRISLERFVELVATNPAKLMGLYPTKGELGVGSDADIVLLDPNASWTVRHAELHMRADWNCWDGWELNGRVVRTIQRGETLVEDGRWVGTKGGGRFLERPKWSPAPKTGVACPI